MITLGNSNQVTLSVIRTWRGDYYIACMHTTVHVFYTVQLLKPKLSALPIRKLKVDQASFLIEQEQCMIIDPK